MKTQPNAKRVGRKFPSTSPPAGSVSPSTQTSPPTGPPAQTPSPSAPSYQGNLTKNKKLSRALEEAKKLRLKMLTKRYRIMAELDILNREIPQTEKVIQALEGNSAITQQPTKPVVVPHLPTVEEGGPLKPELLDGKKLSLDEQLRMKTAISEGSWE
jgi:hypothetical protein